MTPVSAQVTSSTRSTSNDAPSTGTTAAHCATWALIAKLHRAGWWATPSQSNCAQVRLRAARLAAGAQHAVPYHTRAALGASSSCCEREACCASCLARLAASPRGLLRCEEFRTTKRKRVSPRGLAGREQRHELLLLGQRRLGEPAVTQRLISADARLRGGVVACMYACEYRDTVRRTVMTYMR